MNNIITLSSRPEGKPKLDNFNFIKEVLAKPKEGEVVLKTRYVSVDPYLRGRMDNTESYIPPFKIDKPIQSGLIAEVIESRNILFDVGEFVFGILDWKEFQLSNGQGIYKVDAKVAPLSAYLGILGMPGLTAYLGLTKIGKPKKGETIVVSGAAGAVGSSVGQIGKILGCRVIGLAGTDQKVELLKSKFGFDDAVNYKTDKDILSSIARMCPNGVDIYFDNVGGEISDAVILNLNRFGRIPLCGAISMYNTAGIATGPRLEYHMVINSILMQGFIYDNFEEFFPEAIANLTRWLNDGRITYTETIIEGFENLPSAFINLFEGTNEGKMVVAI